MKKKILKIASISSEIDPFSKTGGLADVCRSLPKALKRLGHEVIVITPLYSQIIDKEKNHLKLIKENISVKIDENNQIKTNYWQGYLMKNLPIYFIENEYFSRYKNIYGSKQDNARFLIFDIAALKLISLLKFPADIIQCHDWHTGLIPYFLNKDFKRSDTLKNTATVFTIHNLVFQLGHNWWEIPTELKDNGYSRLPSLDNLDLEKINFAKRAILNVDLINTVSEQYAEEILTKNFGEDLHRILQNRRDRLFGIINGIDYHEYNPATDLGLAKNYNHEKPQAKKENKLALQKYFNLFQNLEIPLIGMTSRLTEQKGFDLILEIIKPLLRLELQLIIMGDGDKKYVNSLEKISKKYHKKFVITPFSRAKETTIYAGGDMLLLPSRFEPCGINPLKSLRYGCIPIVHSIGGLADSITNFNPKTKKGNGFVFKKYDHFDLLVAITRAMETYKYQEIWLELVKRGMKQSFSWEIPAQKYLSLFRKAIKIRKTI